MPIEDVIDDPALSSAAGPEYRLKCAPRAEEAAEAALPREGTAADPNPCPHPLAPRAVVQSFMTKLGKAFCDLVFSGADISSGNFGSLLAVAQLGNLFSLMPLEDSRNYLVGGIFAGMADPKSIASAGVAAGDMSALTDLIDLGLAFAIK